MMSKEKALDSIEYHKSDITKAILEAMKNIKSRDIVPLKMALEYLACE